jgi:hypothetical protein
MAGQSGDHKGAVLDDKPNGIPIFRDLADAICSVEDMTAIGPGRSLSPD